ncbi:MAG: LamG-like jellyroll fold domain-containing protein [Bacteroidota bacterium]|nr:LamG-like jellyroll fold domain-containing protein [Bacteroidota bacterium]
MNRIIIKLFFFQRTFRLCSKIIFINILFLITLTYAQQIKISRIEQMPNIPAPYEMRNWKAVANGYDSLVFDLNRKGDYLPLIFINNNTVNYPSHNSFGLHTVVGTPYLTSGEAINVIPAVVGASLVGIDKSNQNGYNWALMCEEYFNKRPEENIYLNQPVASSGDDWWYETMPNLFFYQLYSLYPNTGDFNRQFTLVADRWLEALKAMGASSTPWKVPFMDYRAFSLSSMSPLATGVHEPEASGAIAWLLYNAYVKTLDEKYRVGAEWAMEFLNGLSSNPAYELQLSYGAFIAAKMNAELRTNYDIEKILNWCFDVGPLRSWGAIIGNWGGYDVSGLIGENSSNDYAFIMNNFEQAGALVPLVRYDKRFARAIGKWVLNIANAARLFYPKYLPEKNQDSYQWAMKYDPESYIAHEAIRKNLFGTSPFATGDAISGGWGQTTLALYGSSHVGLLAGLLDTTNVPMILKLDLLKTDFFHKTAYPTFLYFNPYQAAKIVEIDLGSGNHDLYDVVSNSYLIRSSSGKSSFSIPSDGAVVAVIVPSGGKESYEIGRFLIDNVIVDYHFSSSAANYPPRIKSLSSDSVNVGLNAKLKLYCTAVDIDGDSLVYKWMSSAGVINTTSDPSIAQWISPKDSTGTFKISCVVTDSKGASDSSSVLIKVSLSQNNAPVINMISAHPGKVDLNGQMQIICSASDIDGDSLRYLWRSVDGTLTGQGSRSVYWKAPSTEGNYFISCTVLDTLGASSSDSILVEVRDFSKYSKGSLIAYYPLDGNADDQSSNKLNGISQNTTVSSDKAGVFGKALAFDGLSSNIRVSNSPILNFQNAITVSFWMMPGDLPERESFPISHGSWQNRWKISIIPQKKVRWTIKTSSATRDIDSKTVLQKNVFYFVTALYSGQDAEIYINGQLENFSKVSGLLSTTSYDLTMGQMLPGDNNYDFKGVLDEIKIFDYPLLPSEIQSLYENQTFVQDGPLKPDKYSLSQNYPNPFNPSTKIRYTIPEVTLVKIKVYDILGKEVAELVNEIKTPGTYETGFSEKSTHSSKLSSGIYLYRIETSEYSESKMMIMLK